jgi:uncharacterized SAM-binding protein YcdF (DUF218 family)
MLLVLRSIGNLLINPSVWIWLLIVLFFFLRNKKAKQIVLISATVFFIFFTNHFIGSALIGKFQPPPVNLKDSSGYSVGILLNGFLIKDTHDSVFFTNDADRLIQSVQLYNRGVIKKIFTVGGSADSPDFKDADYVKKELIKIGVRTEDIIIDNSSRNTAESAITSKKLLAGYAPPFVLITSAYHIPRAKMLFDKQGLNTIAYPFNYFGFYRGVSFKSLLMPDASNLYKWQVVIREILGILYYKFK